MNKRWVLKASLVSALFVSAGCASFSSAKNNAEAEAVFATTKKVADWQIRTFEEHGKYRAVSRKAKWQNRNNYEDLQWHNGALYAGMFEWLKISDDENAEAFLMKIGDRNNWSVRMRVALITLTIRGWSIYAVDVGA